jgi:hypothetical protein
MVNFGPAAILGLCFGFMWGIGCSLAILYSIYLAGYHRAVKDSLSENPKKYARYQKDLNKILAKRAQVDNTAAQK